MRTLLLTVALILAWLFILFEVLHANQWESQAAGGWLGLLGVVVCVFAGRALGKRKPPAKEQPGADAQAQS